MELQGLQKQSFIRNIETNHVMLIRSFIRIEGDLKKLGSCYLGRGILDFFFLVVVGGHSELFMREHYSQNKSPSLEHLQISSHRISLTEAREKHVSG